MKTRIVFGGLMVLALFAHSCAKEDQGSISTSDLSLAQNETYADALYEEVDNLVSSELIRLDQSAYSVSTLKSASSETCFTVTVDHPDSTNFPKVVTMDFGDGCSVVFNGDTITREGQIIITITDRWFKPGAMHIVSFNNFYMNGVKIEGTKTNKNLGLNAQNHLMLEVVLEGGKITFNDSTFMTRDANHVREIIRHFAPRYDTILVTGSANGINVAGETYTREIIDPLVLVHCAEYNWRWIISGGKVEITNSVSGITTIDHSGSGCTGTVIVNKNGYRHNYDFKYNYRKNTGGH